jgi:hypothetical protein
MQPPIRYAALILVAFSSAARAEATSCTEIASVPVNITAPGVYCLKKSVSLAIPQGQAITILTDDVVLDLNGHVLANFPGAAGEGARGIYANNRKNITLRNGAIRGFAIGVNLENSAGNSMAHLVEHLLLDRSTHIGLAVDGEGSVIRGNRIVRTGAMSFTYGIFAAGAGTHVIANEVTATVEKTGGQAYGIYAYLLGGGAVERNVVGNWAYGPSASTGIYVANGSGVTVAGNRITNMRTGIFTFGGAPNLYLDNAVGGAATPFVGGVMAGTSNYTF